MALRDQLEALPAADAKTALSDFILKFCTPAFGALPKREIELAVFDLMSQLGLVRADASLYELMTDLRVTRAKASQLIFDRDVRMMGGDAGRLDGKVREALQNTRFTKDGDYFVIEVENPLVVAHLKNRLRDLGHLSDSSFNAALVRMSNQAAVDLTLHVLSEEQRTAVQDGLRQAGARDGSLKGMVRSAFVKLGQRFVGNAADELVDNASDFLGPIFNEGANVIRDQWSQLFNDEAE